MSRVRIGTGDVLAALAALCLLGGVRLLCWVGCKLVGAI